MEKTLTNREVLNYMLKEYSTDEVVVKYATHQLELLDRKNSNRVNKSNEEDIKITDMIIEAISKMTTNEKKLFTVTEILNYETLKNYICESTNKALSNSKITALLGKELKSGTARVVNVKDKKHSFYSLV